MVLAKRVTFLMTTIRRKRAGKVVSVKEIQPPEQDAHVPKTLLPLALSLWGLKNGADLSEAQSIKTNPSNGFQLFSFGPNTLKAESTSIDTAGLLGSETDSSQAHAQMMQTNRKANGLSENSANKKRPRKPRRKFKPA